MREEGKGKVTKKRINKNISKRIRKRMHRIGMERKRLRRDVRKIEEERRYDEERERVSHVRSFSHTSNDLSRGGVNEI